MLLLRFLVDYRHFKDHRLQFQMTWTLGSVVQMTVASVRTKTTQLQRVYQWTPQILKRHIGVLALLPAYDYLSLLDCLVVDFDPGNDQPTLLTFILDSTYLI